LNIRVHYTKAKLYVSFVKTIVINKQNWWKHTVSREC